MAEKKNSKKVQAISNLTAPQKIKLLFTKPKMKKF